MADNWDKALGKWLDKSKGPQNRNDLCPFCGATMGKEALCPGCASPNYSHLGKGNTPQQELEAIQRQMNYRRWVMSNPAEPFDPKKEY